jgi:comEA protein
MAAGSRQPEARSQEWLVHKPSAGSSTRFLRPSVFAIDTSSAGMSYQGHSSSELSAILINRSLNLCYRGGWFVIPGINHEDSKAPRKQNPQESGPLFFAQNRSRPLEEMQPGGFILPENSSRYFRTGGEMRSKKMSLAWTVILCLGLVMSPALASAQKAKAASVEKVNLNTATLEQLQTLPGIGPSTAKGIIEHRTKIGKFTKIEEILNVKGIGEKKFQKIKDRLIV